LPGTYRAGFPELLDLTPPEGDALAAVQAERVLAEQADHPEARRLRAPLRLGSDPAGALDDMDTYLRQEADPLTQVRVLTLRNQINAAAPANAPAPQPAWTGFALTADADDGALYFHAASALGAFIDEVPASQATLRPLLEAACRKGLACFESYFSTGEGDPRGHGGNADPHLYSLLCRLLARLLPADEAHLEEKLALHRKGMAASDFIDHWIDLLDTHAAAGQHQQVVDLAGEVMNRYPVERNPGNVSWVFSRLVAAWAAIGGREATESASAAISHMDARLTRCRWKRAARAPMPWRTLAPTMPGCSSPAWRRWTNMTCRCAPNSKRWSAARCWSKTRGYAVGSARSGVTLATTTARCRCWSKPCSLARRWPGPARHACSGLRC
jgi:hypothetical protein